MDPAERADLPWIEQVEAFLLHLLHSRPQTRGSSIQTALHTLVGIVPGGGTAAAAAAVSTRLAHAVAPRPPIDLPRDGVETAERLAAANRKVRPREAIAILLMCRSGSRLADATKLAAGWHQRAIPVPGAFAWWPEVEKTDHAGTRVTEPVVLPLLERPSPGKWLRLAQRLAAEPRLSGPETAAMRRAARSILLAGGIRDVRALRRATAAAAAAAGGRAAAAEMLRHKAGSAATVRYTTTADAIPRLLRTLSVAPEPVSDPTAA